jgi:hypothetical protein
MSPYLNIWTFEFIYQTVTSTVLLVRSGVAQGSIQPVCKRYAFAFLPRRVFSLRRKQGQHKHVPAASAARQISGDYLSNLERWLRDWRIGINFQKGSAMLFVKTGRRVPKHGLVHLIRDPIQWFDNARYLSVTLDK